MAGFNPSDAMYVAVGTLFLAGALALLFYNFGDRLNRVFALYLFLEGGAMLTYTVPLDSWWQIGLRNMFPYLALGTSFPLLYLAAAYRDRFGRPGLRQIALPLLVVAAVIVELLHLSDHTLFFGRGARPLRPIHYVLIILGPSFLAALLGRDALRTNDPQRRSHLLAASLAFAFYPPAFALHLFVVPELMLTHPAEEWTALLGLAPIVFFVAQLSRIAFASQSTDRRLAARKYLGILSLSPLSVLFLGAVNTAAPEAGDDYMRFIMTGWLVVLAGLIGYAVLRHQLFGIEMGLKWTIRRGTLPSMLVAIFFVVFKVAEELAEETLQEYSWVIAGVAAAAVGSLYKPIQRRVDLFANKTLPGVQRTTEYVAFRRLQLYQSAIAAVWEDGVMDRDERVRLERLRRKLGISDHDAQELESDFVRQSQGRKRPATKGVPR